MANQNHENQNKDKWLLSFSGFLMLLFATFVVLFATVNNKNKELESKLEEKVAFHEDFQTQKLTMIQESIRSDPELSSQSLSSMITDRGLEIRFVVADFYPETGYIPSEDLLPLIDALGKKIKEFNMPFMVIGHADESEKEIYSNDEFLIWTLTAQRAGWIAERWMSLFSIQPDRVTVSSRSYFEPHAIGDQNAQNWARSRNRRVEIIVQPKPEGRS